MRVLHPRLRRAGRPRNVGIAAPAASSSSCRRRRRAGAHVPRADDGDGDAEYVGHRRRSLRQHRPPVPAAAVRAVHRALHPRVRAQPRRGPTARRPAVPPRVPRREPAGLQEDWQKSEDQAFTFSAMLRSRVISVLGGLACYHYHVRPDAENISAEPIDPVTRLRVPARRSRHGLRRDGAGSPSLAHHPAALPNGHARATQGPGIHRGSRRSSRRDHRLCPSAAVDYVDGEAVRGLNPSRGRDRGWPVPGRRTRSSTWLAWSPAWMARLTRTHWAGTAGASGSTRPRGCRGPTPGARSSWSGQPAG